MKNNTSEQENNHEKTNQKESFGQNNFVGWGGAILSLLGVLLAMTDEVNQSEVFAISLFVSGATLSFVALQFKPLWIAFFSIGISCVAFFFLLSLLRGI